GGPDVDARRERLEGLDFRAVLAEIVLRVVGRAASLPGRRGAPREDPAAQGAPRDEAHAVSLARGQDLELDRALEKVVEALFGDEPEEPARPRGLVPLHDVPRGEVAAPDIEDLPLLDQYLHRLPDLVPGDLAVDVVHLVEVDVVGLHAAQALIA